MGESPFSEPRPYSSLNVVNSFWMRCVRSYTSSVIYDGRDLIHNIVECLFVV